jgi:ribose transport system substrate-binding protein
MTPAVMTGSTQVMTAFLISLQITCYNDGNLHPLTYKLGGISMKYFFYALVSVLFLILMMLYSLNTSPLLLTTTDKINQPSHHLTLITQGSKEPFWKSLIKGAEKAGTESNSFVEIIDIPPYDVIQMAAAIDRAVLSDTDAIALQPINDPLIAERLEIAKLKKIPIITFENDTFTLEGIPTIGSSSYNIGQNLAKLAIEATSGKARIALLLNSKQSEDPRYKSLKLQGLIDKLSEYPEMIVTSINTVDIGLYEADRLTRSLLSENPDTNLIICTDERRTPGVAQALVDTNAVGIIQIIGFGNMEQTIKYIERGVIYGTICSDGYEIGYSTVTSLLDLIKKTPISESHATTIYSYTLENLNSYYDRFSESTILE